MSRDIAPFGLRMPQEIKESLAKQAKINKRSLNAELVDRLSETLKQDSISGSYKATTNDAISWEKHLNDIDRRVNNLTPTYTELKNRTPKGKRIKNSEEIDMHLENIMSLLRNEVINMVDDFVYEDEDG